MDRTEEYRAIVKRVMQGVADYLKDHDGIHYELVMDDSSGHYEFLKMGWEDGRRVHHSLIHIDVRDDKVYVENEDTDLVVVEDLLDEGIPKGHIVMGFHPPQHRHRTKFAVA